MKSLQLWNWSKVFLRDEKQMDLEKVIPSDQLAHALVTNITWNTKPNVGKYSTIQINF